MKFTTACMALLLLLSTAGIHDARAEQTDETPAALPTSKTPAVLSSSESKEDLATLEKNMDMSDVMALFRQQQQELAAQRKLLEGQSQEIATLTNELRAIQAATPSEANQDETAQELAAQRKLLESQSQEIATLTQELDVMRAPPPSAAPEVTAESGTTSLAATPPTAVSDASPEQSQMEKEKAIETGDEVAQAQADDPSRDMLKAFKGAWRLPGTNAALRIGGFVKTAIVYNYDALQIKDRFIVGSIPVGIDETTGDEAQSSITADQSRLNFDLRQPTDYGIMRAFIEGDFAGSSNDTFRLRHAFGQWNRVLAGKTWTAFMDPDASPEELDFEGLNGRINIRQAQVRFMPTLGKEYELQFSMEDPNPEIQNGSGVTRTPDLVLAGRFNVYKRLHMKLALIAREIRGQSTNGDVAKEFAWGASLSGNVATPRFDDRDKLLFQLSQGDGIGRYVNDLSSIGNYDGIFEPDTGNLQLFDVTAGYISWQHWWGVNELRSNFTFSAVEVDNPGFLEGDAYKRTLRFSSNLIWSPISRINIGGEFLWGQRENEDSEDGNATQLQFAVKYRF